MSHHYVDNDFYKALNIDNNFNWFIINNFYKSIDSDKDWVIAVSFLVY